VVKSHEPVFRGDVYRDVAPLVVTFAGGSRGDWRVERIVPVRGASLPSADRLHVVEGDQPGASTSAVWSLRGVTSNLHYTSEGERLALLAAQPPLGRAGATKAALIPVRKSDRWWGLAQDERRAIFEERSHHINTGLRYLPAVARRLHHCRELGEPFDFLTWFEYAPEDERGFEQLVDQLRRTEEWTYVDREVDVRLAKEV
jgi:hypothetical protein